MEFAAGMLRDVADHIEKRLMPLCDCEQCVYNDKADTVRRAAQMVRDRAALLDGQRP